MIDKDQYNQWRNHPATLFFRQFLKDRREALIREASEQWLNGDKVFDQEGQVMRGAITELFRVEDIPYEAIETFYKEKEGDAAKDTVDQTS